MAMALSHVVLMAQTPRPRAHATVCRRQRNHAGGGGEEQDKVHSKGEGSEALVTMPLHPELATWNYCRTAGRTPPPSRDAGKEKEATVFLEVQVFPGGKDCAKASLGEVGVPRWSGL